ncbi:MAG TPA: DUF4349 domain-containing protein [Flavobacteriales bacterium]|nr:DUF4349 domain-containing protein [Flavobacteriales bacterium]
MNQITKYLVLVLLVIVIGCHSNTENASMEMAKEEIVAPTSANKVEQVERKLIKDGRVEFETESIKSTRKTVFKAVDKYKGYISSDQEYKSPGRSSNTIVIRVPAKDFDNLLNDATSGVDKFESKEINVKDVTEEFLDIQARLKTKKELESRFLDLLKQAKTVTEILEIEKQIGELRSDIESIEGRLKYLEDQVSLSTLTMTFYQSNPDETEFGRKFKNGFRNGWENLIWFFVFLTNIWPFILIGLGLIIGIRFYRRRK